MGGSPLAKKLHIKPGYAVALLNPPEGYRAVLGKLPEGVTVSLEAEGKFDLIHLFVRDIAQLQDWAPAALRAIKRDGVLWISYPKKSSGLKTDISRDVGWQVLKDHGFRPVSVVSVDDVWSALRFRLTEIVGKPWR